MAAYFLQRSQIWKEVAGRLEVSSLWRNARAHVKSQASFLSNLRAFGANFAVVRVAYRSLAAIFPSVAYHGPGRRVKAE